jgi:fructosamine-3-kinase
MQTDLESFRQRRRATFYPKTDAPVSDQALRSGAALAVSSAEIIDLCGKALGQEPAWAAPLDQQGTFHTLFHVALPASRRVVVRLSSFSPGVRDYSLCAGQWASSQVRAAGLPAVRVLCVDLSRRLVSFDYEILEHAQGQPLSSMDHDEPRMRRMLEALGTVLAGIHQITVDGFGWIDVAPGQGGQPEATGRGLFDSWPEYLLVNFAAHLQACLEIGAITPRERAWIEAAYDDLAGQLGPIQPALLHGDLSSRNVFADGLGITALLDWEDCLAGDPVYDLAFWATFHPAGRHASLLDAYAAARPLPADFEPRFWLYYLRIALSKTVQRHRFGYTDLPGRPPASRRIQQALARLATAIQIT